MKKVGADNRQPPVVRSGQLQQTGISLHDTNGKKISSPQNQRCVLIISLKKRNHALF